MDARTRRWLSSGVALLGLVGLGMGPIDACSGFLAELSGEEVIEPVDTDAAGTLLLLYTEVTPPSEAIPEGVPAGGPLAGREPAQIDFKLRVSDTADVPESGDEGQLLAARLHCAPAGENGPVAVTLFEAEGGGVVTPTGVNGTLTDASIDEENDCGLVAIEDLLALMEAGEVYVQVETNAFPEGEIRGQVRQAGDD